MPTYAFNQIAGLALRAAGLRAPVETYEAYLCISFLWPWTLLPLGWWNFRVLRWNWLCGVALVFVVNLLLALLVLLAIDWSRGSFAALYLDRRAPTPLAWSEKPACS